jgi:membrane protein implicated in regulation of membrane protease activity
MEIVFGWLLRALSRVLRFRSPATATAIGLGSESIGALSAKPADLVGRIGHVEIAIAAGRGRVRIDGVSWPAEGEDVSIDHPVRIVRVDGNRLIIERI